MHPVVQLTLSVAVVVIAARLWPPLLYILSVLVILLFLVKAVRRAAGWASKKSFRGFSDSVLSVCIFGGLFLSIAAAADYFIQPKFSAVTMVLCFAGAIAVVGVLVNIVEYAMRRYR